MRILVTGASGLLGSKFTEIAAENHEVISIFNTHQPIAGTPVKLDLTNLNLIEETLLKFRPDAILHAAALTNVDKCEIDRRLALRINYEATQKIAEVANKMRSFLLYVSTDYVFDGRKGNYREEDEVNPINHYGYTKLKGEEAVIQKHENYCIARTSVIYGARPAAGKANFALWIIENLSQNKPIKLLTDQYVSPTLNTNLSKMLLEIIEREINGIIHTAGATRTSRIQFGEKLAEVFQLNQKLISPIKMNEISWKAKRPRDSSLNVDKAQKILRNKPANMDESLRQLKLELK